MRRGSGAEAGSIFFLAALLLILRLFATRSGCYIGGRQHHDVLSLALSPHRRGIRRMILSAAILNNFQEVNLIFGNEMRHLI